MTTILSANQQPVNELKELTIRSAFLHRDLTVSLLVPQQLSRLPRSLPLIVFQDGQDFEAIELLKTVNQLLRTGTLPPLVIAGVHANHDRVLEYGVARQADYNNRGHRAGAYTSFVVQELLPFLAAHYPLSATPAHRVVAGFSLGGLMALDIAWNHPLSFGKTGVFSGSLWWRQKVFGSEYRDSDRIMHAQIRQTATRPDLKFWFQTGTSDETDDRDGDGVIDSIADTLDCMAELERKGYLWGKDLIYQEVAGGEHRPATWGAIMPSFLKWAMDR